MWLQSIADENDFVIVNNTVFDYLGEAQDIVIPNGVTAINNGVFGESEIKSVVISEGVEEIAERAFEDCKYLSKISLPHSLKKIAKDVFSLCPKLTTIIIPEGVEEIDEAFRDCGRLKKVYLPKSVEKIAHFAFCYKSTIYAPIGSYAEQYAKENNIPFVAE